MCNHKPREALKAMMTLGDEVLTCRKCGGEVIAEKDPGQRRMFSVLILILALVFSAIFRMLLMLFFSADVSTLLSKVCAVLLSVCGWYVYVMLFAEYEIL